MPSLFADMNFVQKPVEIPIEILIKIPLKAQSLEVSIELENSADYACERWE